MRARSDLYRVAVQATFVLAVAAAASIAVAPAASADTSATPGAVVVSADGVRLAAKTSTAFAGYSAAVSGSTTISASFVVPTVSCTASSTSPVYQLVGVFGSAASGFVESAGVFKGTCNGTTPVYQAFVIIDSITNSSPVAVAPRDTLTVKGTVSTSMDKFTIANTRTGAAVAGTGTGLTATGAQFTTQGGINGAGFPAFTRFSISRATVNGGTLGAAQPTKFQQVSAGGAVLIKAAALSASGKAFSTQFVASP